MNVNMLIDDDLEVYLNGTLIGTHDGNANDGGGSNGAGFCDPTPYSYYVTVPTFDGSLWVDEPTPSPFTPDNGIQRAHTTFSASIIINGTNTIRIVTTTDNLSGNGLQVIVFDTSFSGGNWQTDATHTVSVGVGSGNPAVNETSPMDESYTFTYP